MFNFFAPFRKILNSSTEMNLRVILKNEIKFMAEFAIFIDLKKNGFFKFYAKI